MLIAENADDEDDEDVEFVIDNQNVNANTQDNFYNSAFFNDDKDDNEIDLFMLCVPTHWGKGAGCRGNSRRPPKPNTEGISE